jgi:3',5'-cyclic AMP phosphodiesterase CpdA
VFVLAHLSDPHLAPLPTPRLGELASKRFVGYLNWLRKRRAIHRRDVLAAIVADLRVARADHIAVTGDLVNIALPAEIENAAHWLEALGPPAQVSLVPGNHDAYVPGAAGLFTKAWAPYMLADAKNGDNLTFPFLRVRGPVALIGVSTAIATPPLMATGKIGEQQIACIAKMLDDLRAENLFRVVMIHHPPLPSASHKCLIDAVAFQRALAAAGAELVIHGHDHVHSLVWIAGNGGRIPVIGVPSASASASTKKRAGAYNLYLIGGSYGAWSCEVVSRGLRPSGTVAELDRFALSWSESA